MKHSNAFGDNWHPVINPLQRGPRNMKTVSIFVPENSAGKMVTVTVTSDEIRHLGWQHGDRLAMDINSLPTNKLIRLRRVSNGSDESTTKVSQPKNNTSANIRVSVKRLEDTIGSFIQDNYVPRREVDYQIMSGTLVMELTPKKAA